MPLAHSPELRGGQKDRQQDEKEQNLDTEAVADDANDKTEREKRREIADQRRNKHELAIAASRSVRALSGSGRAEATEPNALRARHPVQCRHAGGFLVVGWRDGPVDDLLFTGVAPVVGLEKQARSPAAAETFGSARGAGGTAFGCWEVEQVG